MRATLLLCVLVACAHGPRGASTESLKAAAEEIHQRARWKDYRGVAVLVTPDRRTAFAAALKRGQDDRDLSITDYELLDARIGEDKARGEVLSRLSWTRLPSVTEQSEEVRSRFTFEAGAWYLESQVGGPFAAYLPP